MHGHFRGVLHCQIIDDELIPHSKRGSSDLLHINAIINQMNIQWRVFHIAHVMLRNLSFAEHNKQHLVKLRDPMAQQIYIMCKM